MSSDMKIPEWAMVQGMEIAEGSEWKDYDDIAREVAVALLAAEQRGLEKAAGYHDERAASAENSAWGRRETRQDWGGEVSPSEVHANASAAHHRISAAAIRSLGDKT